MAAATVTTHIATITTTTTATTSSRNASTSIHNTSTNGSSPTSATTTTTPTIASSTNSSETTARIGSLIPTTSSLSTVSASSSPASSSSSSSSSSSGNDGKDVTGNDLRQMKICNKSLVAERTTCQTVTETEESQNIQTIFIDNCTQTAEYEQNGLADNNLQHMETTGNVTSENPKTVSITKEEQKNLIITKKSNDNERSMNIAQNEKCKYRDMDKKSTTITIGNANRTNNNGKITIPKAGVRKNNETQGATRKSKSINVDTREKPNGHRIGSTENLTITTNLTRKTRYIRKISESSATKADNNSIRGENKQHKSGNEIENIPQSYQTTDNLTITRDKFNTKQVVDKLYAHENVNKTMSSPKCKPNNDHATHLQNEVNLDKTESITKHNSGGKKTKTNNDIESEPITTIDTQIQNKSDRSKSLGSPSEINANDNKCKYKNQSKNNLTSQLSITLNKTGPIENDKQLTNGDYFESKLSITLANDNKHTNQAMSKSLPGNTPYGPSNRKAEKVTNSSSKCNHNAILINRSKEPQTSSQSKNTFGDCKNVDINAMSIRILTRKASVEAAPNVSISSEEQSAIAGVCSTAVLNGNDNRAIDNSRSLERPTNNTKKRKKSKTKPISATLQTDRLTIKDKSLETKIPNQNLSIHANEFKPISNDASADVDEETKSVTVETGDQTNNNKSPSKPIRILKRNIDSTSDKLSTVCQSEISSGEKNFAQNEMDLIRNLCECDNDGNAEQSIAPINQSDNTNTQNGGANGNLMTPVQGNNGADIDNVENERTVEDDNSLNVEPSTSAAVENLAIRNCSDSKTAEATAVLNSSDKCVCFCSASAASEIVSALENGYGLSSSVPDQEYSSCAGIDDIDESDLPNYSQSCVYEQRIIDFENFRIIEQVIDSNCEGKHEANHTDKCRNDYDRLATAAVENCTEEIDERWQKIFNILPDALKAENKIINVVDNSCDSQEQIKDKVNESHDDIIIEKRNDKCKINVPNKSQSHGSLKRVTNNSDNSVNIPIAKHPIYRNPSLNFSCSELVAFIGDSFRVIDSAQAVYRSEPPECKEFVPRNLPKTKTKESSSVGNSPFRRSKRSIPSNSNRVMPSNRSVDDNNNTRRYTGITAAERLMQSLNCDVSRELASASSKKDKRDTKAAKNPKHNNTNEQATTPTKTLIKALKSKLTPLAPPFQPSSSSKAQVEASLAPANGDTTSSTASSTTAYLNYEQTTIYYQQHHHLQQPQQQLLMPSGAFLNFPTATQQQQVAAAAAQQQQQLFIPQLQQTHHHHQQQQHISPHQQHCAQNMLAMTSAAAMLGQGMPHIHLPATAATNTGNLTTAVALNLGSSPHNAATAHTHLMPVHLLSTMGGAITSWPLVDAAAVAAQNVNSAATATAASTPTVYIDLNGELRSICPAHGPPPTAVGLTAQPMAALGNQTASNGVGASIAAAASGISNSTQYPTGAYQHQQPPQPIPMHQQQYNQHYQPHHNHQHQHQTLPQTFSQNSPRRLKSNSNAVASAQSTSCSPAAGTTSPRVVLQLDAGLSLPLQIAGKRKLIQGKSMTGYCDIPTTE